ncbi:glyoxalase [Siccirubricoccus deserti]|uniref:VOC family protein n=1 Tax=Siccirubricoccus deserti TaxID=2013562 RepID=A0A9X0UEA7_9PROT|nr:VOC family protein [Siccirubricoccus deserti]MBC4017382.1 VOC family protein [Siccirubricoccus deserti]GGC58373.1 glyoxalase [Siccirubricoccus deserti]
MIDHVSITVPDLAAAARFYDAVMAALGVAVVGRSAEWVGYGLRADAAHPGRSYLSVRAGPRPEAAASWQAGIAAGGADDGPPGLRPHYHPEYFAAFLRDPAGNRIEVVCHEARS